LRLAVWYANPGAIRATLFGIAVVAGIVDAGQPIGAGQTPQAATSALAADRRRLPPGALALSTLGTGAPMALSFPTLGLVGRGECGQEGRTDEAGLAARDARGDQVGKPFKPAHRYPILSRERLWMLFGSDSYPWTPRMCGSTHGRS
jgi:hypothetical protein